MAQSSKPARKQECERKGLLLCIAFAVLLIGSQTLMLPNISLKLESSDEPTNLRIVCVSDTHGLYQELPMLEGDVVIFAGDTEVALADHARLVEFNNWLGSLQYEYRIIIPGNMDIWLQRDVKTARQILSNAMLLIDEQATINVRGSTYVVYGAPWTPTSVGIYQLRNEQEARSIWSKIPSRVDILVTHGPPLGILDMVSSTTHVGDKWLLEAVNRVKPHLHVFGHAHYSAGRVKKNGTTFVNAAQRENLESSRNPPIVVELQPTARRWLRIR